MRARLSLPIFCSMSESDIGKTLPFAQTTTAGLPAASIASNTAGRSFDCGVGRNWLSMITATLRGGCERAREKRGPETGDSSAARARRRRVADGRRLVRVDGREQVRLRDLELERVARDLVVVARRTDRQRVERLVGDHRRIGVRHRSSSGFALVWVLEPGYARRRLAVKPTIADGAMPSKPATLVRSHGRWPSESAPGE